MKPGREDNTAATCRNVLDSVCHIVVEACVNALFAFCNVFFFEVDTDFVKCKVVFNPLEALACGFKLCKVVEVFILSTDDTIRFVGGGALSSLTCQILADCTGRTIETTESPQNAGSVGAAITAAVGLGVIDNMEQAKDLVKANATYKPNPANKAVYDKNFEVFKQLYKANKKNFSMLNG